MEHEEVKRIVSGAKTAVLFIHGIVGTPRHFDEFVRCVPPHISVYNMLLDGHGKRVRDFAHTSMEKWEAQVQKAVEEFASVHEKIYIVAHSMGTLFAIEQAIKNKKVAKLFLLAVPIKLFLKWEMFSNAMKVYRNQIQPDDYAAIAAQKSYGIAPDKNMFHYLGWIPRYLELFGKIRETGKALGSLNTPCLAFQSAKDEMVSVKSVACLKKNSAVCVTELKNSGHYRYDEKDLNFLLDAFRAWIAE